MRFETLFTPIKIGSCEIKNRFVVPPMDSGIPNADGSVNQKTIDYYAERAKGGFGLVVVEYCHVDPKGKPMPNTLGIYDDKFMPGMRQLTDEVHKYDGAKVFLQLHHCGREGNPMVTGTQLEAPSAIPCPVCRAIPREFTTQEVYELIEQFGDAAYRAQQSGFDGVEIHGGHGYLIAQFISCYTNKRLDEFGGSFRDRMRFPELIIKNIKKKVGNGFPVSMRISGEERVAGGRDINESRAVAKYLEGAGLDSMNVSTGLYASNKWVIVPSQVDAEYNIYAAEAIKQSTEKLVVIGGGRINDPYYAEEVLTSGRADMIFLGRGSLADPHFPNKAAAGAYEEITPCIGCLQRCKAHLNKPGNVVSCLMNPSCGFEAELKIIPAEKPKRIAVVGGGPGGLYAAWVSAKRGHEVTLFEKTGVPGGQFRLGSIPPFKHELARGIKYMTAMCKKYGVDMKFNTEATAGMLTGYDSVVLATGGVPLEPDLPGANGDNIVLAVDILDGKANPSGNILVVGGGIVGVEIADFLGERYNRITVVEMTDQIAPTMPLEVKGFMMPRLQEYGVEFKTNTKVKAFLPDGAVCEVGGKEVTLNGFDHIVSAMGAKAYNPLEEQLQGKVADLHVVGDAVQARTAQEAIEEAYRLAVKI